MKVIIAGSRDFDNYDRLEIECDTVLSVYSKLDYIEAVSGGARGTDKLGEKYAKERGLGLKIFPADWNKHGRSAGYKRNKKMAKYADMLIAFWDGESRGTKNMIDLAKEQGLMITVIHYKNALI